MAETVYLVRHGQSVANVDDKFWGPEVPLTEKGEQQAARVAKRCAALDFDVIHASTMERARRTAWFIHEETGKPIEYFDDLVERKEPPRLIGMYEWDPKCQQLHYEWTESFLTSGKKVEGGENFEEIVNRAERMLGLWAKHPAHSIVAVGHGFFLRCIMARIMFGENITPDQLRGVLFGMTSTNTGLSQIIRARDNVWHPWVKDGDWLIRIWNDAEHLGESTTHE